MGVNNTTELRELYKCSIFGNVVKIMHIGTRSKRAAQFSVQAKDVLKVRAN